MAAGAVVVSDAPSENRRVFRHCGVELPLGSVPGRLPPGSPAPAAVVELVKLWASDAKAQARAEKAAAGGRFARLNLSPTAWLETLLESYDARLAQLLCSVALGRTSLPFAVSADHSSAICT